MPLRAGDEVYHWPSNKDWVLATDERDGLVYFRGQPETAAKVSDCALLGPSTEDEGRG